MTPKQSLEWLKSFESIFGNTNYRVCGIDCWPVVRNIILSKINAGYVRSDTHKFIFIYKGFFLAILSSLKSLKSLTNIRKADVFILSDNKFSESIDGHIYLNDAHAISESVEFLGKNAIIALQGKFIDEKIVKNKRCYSIYFIVALSAFLSRLNFFVFLIPGLSKYVNNTVASINEHLDSTGNKSYKVTKRHIAKNIIFSIVAKELFTILLRMVGPTKAYVVCYYSTLGMSFCAACKQLGIHVSDVQHGVSGRNMRSYGNWLSCPRHGYSTLPDSFLTWTKYDCFAINESLNRRHGRHIAVRSGLLWRSFKIRHGLDIISQNEWNDFLSRISHYDRKIIVTLQSSTLPDVVLELIEACGLYCCFLIRAHPNVIIDSENSDLLDYENSYSNVFVLESTKIPIQTLMSVADVNITGWSASVYDAYFEGVRSVVITKLGQDYFEDFIEAGVVFYTEKPNMIKEYALNLSRFPPCSIEYHEGFSSVLDI